MYYLNRAKIKGLKIIILELFIFILSSVQIYSQVLPDNATLSDIASLKDDLTNRIANVPNEASEISEERRWLQTVRVSIQNEINYYTISGEVPDIEKFKGELLMLSDKVSKLNCKDLSDSKFKIDAIYSEFRVVSQDDGIVDIFNPEKEWIKIAEKFKKLTYFTSSQSRPNPPTFNLTECSSLITIFSSEELKKEINDFISSKKIEFDKISKDRTEKLNMLNAVELEIDSYYIKLNEAWQKSKTKMSLQTNLYLMILVIGLLSIATIAIIKWFPEDIMREWVESGQVIQFVTVMILLSVIMALGLAGLLSENTLGTLLGGIGGYVLSQGVGRSAARAALKDLKDNAQTKTVESSMPKSN